MVDPSPTRTPARSTHRRLLSTSVCPLPAPSGAVLERWRELGGGELDGLALDPRLTADARAELLARARGLRVPCRELAHPAGPGPSLASADRDERRAARLALEASLVLAHRHGVQRVLLPPSTLPLRTARSELARRFARGEPLGLEAVDQERALLAREALDRLCLVLEPCLKLAEGLDLRLAFPWPSPWPHGLPDGAELTELCAAFDGAPLATCLYLDWAAIRATLRGESSGELPSLAAPARLASVRVADACGLGQRLPLGSGEADWRRFLEEVELDEAEADLVLCFRPDTRAEEVTRALALLDQNPGG